MDSIKQRIENLENSFGNNKHEDFAEKFSKMTPQELNAYIFKCLNERPRDPELEKMTSKERHAMLMDLLREGKER